MTDFVKETQILLAREALTGTSCSSCEFGPDDNNSGCLSDSLKIHKACWACEKINNETCRQCGRILVAGACPNAPGICSGIHGLNEVSVIVNFKKNSPHLQPFGKTWIETDGHNNTVVLSQVQNDDGRTYAEFALGCLVV